jgi:hypothetical protein
VEDGFAAWAKDFVLFCHITTRVEDDPYQDLLQEKGGRGFPYLAFLDAEGNVIGKHQGARTVAGFRQSGEKIGSFLELKKRAEGGDKAAGADYLVARIELGLVEGDEVEREVQALGELTPEQHATLDPLLNDVQIRGILKGVNPKDRETVFDAGKRFLEMMQAGKLPKGKQEAQAFWGLIMGYAEQQQDAATYETGLEAMKQLLGNHPNAKAFLAQAEQKLEAMKAEAPEPVDIP